MAKIKGNGFSASKYWRLYPRCCKIMAFQNCACQIVQGNWRYESFEGLHPSLGCEKDKLSLLAFGLDTGYVLRFNKTNPN